MLEKLLANIRRSILGKKIPILRMSVLEVAIILMVIGGGTTVIFMTRRQPARTTDSNSTNSTASEAEDQTVTTAQGTSPQTEAPSGRSSESENPSHGVSAQQSYEDAKEKLAWQQTMCVEPMSRINEVFLNAQQQAVSKYSSDINAISFAPGTPQYRAVYNSAAFARNYNIQTSYETFISSINTLNSTANCGVTPAYRKYSYANMMNASYDYLPYIEGSNLHDY